MIFGREPALIAGVINAFLALIITFGVHLTIEQVGAILAFTNVVLALLVRGASTPTAAPVLPIGTAVTTPGGDTSAPTLIVSGASPNRPR